MPASHPPWGSAKRLQMAIAIRDAGQPLTPKALAEVVQRHVSNVASGLEDLTGEGLLDRVAGPPRPPGIRGKWPKYGYALSAKGTATLNAQAQSRAEQSSRGADEPDVAPTPPDVELVRPTDLEVGLLDTGTQLVFADATASALPELFHVLAGAEVLADAAWSGLTDGDPQEYVVAFSGDRAAALALDLLALLTGARISARRTAIAELRSPEEFREDMARRAASAKRARMSRDTREAS